MRFGKAAAPVSDTDPDYVLKMFRFHRDVYGHNPDDCEEDSCDYCSWDNYDTWGLVVHFGGLLDDWMSGGGRPPREWSRHGFWRRTRRRLSLRRRQ